MKYLILLLLVTNAYSANEKYANWTGIQGSLTKQFTYVTRYYLGGTNWQIQRIRGTDKVICTVGKYPKINGVAYGKIPLSFRVNHSDIYNIGCRNNDVYPNAFDNKMIVVKPL